MASGAGDAQGTRGDATGGSAQEVPWKGVSSVYATTTRGLPTLRQRRGCSVREELLQRPSGVDFFSGKRETLPV